MILLQGIVCKGVGNANCTDVFQNDRFIAERAGISGEYSHCLLQSFTGMQFCFPQEIKCAQLSDLLFGEVLGGERRLKLHVLC